MEQHNSSGTFLGLGGIVNQCYKSTRNVKERGHSYPGPHDDMTRPVVLHHSVSNRSRSLAGTHAPKKKDRSFSSRNRSFPHSSSQLRIRRSAESTQSLPRAGPHGLPHPSLPHLPHAVPAPSAHRAPPPRLRHAPPQSIPNSCMAGFPPHTFAVAMQQGGRSS